ncbi:DUF3761 domain-containing protein [Arthrobacter bambusae]|uniref:DUF3761 domain-containing protein n=1 Tax=Arthrobacter bambusae TaxID=1338426 RepID=UPI00277E54A8|nr:DUF3761 domain-containing protein [Arthrobacter bambusae]MDQ0030814.1 hypothetical protein [Arthrobacter bambusae]MDQ0099179.1 hypothetical protein [Arthrobacter bambusae]
MLDRPSAVARPKRRWQPSKSFWIVAALVLLLAILFTASSGFGGFLFLLGLVAVITGLYALIFKRQSWVGLPHRKSAALVAAAGVVAFIVGAGVASATATPGSVPDKSAFGASSRESVTATPTATNPANSACLTPSETRNYNNNLFICTMGSDQRLVWLAESDSKRVVAQKAAADKAAADKVAADKAAADKAAADKAAADKVAADKAAADKAAADKVAADKATADKAAADALAAQQAADQQAAADQAAAAQQTANQGAPQQNASGATALCADGTLSFSANHRGTCSYHGGVSVWYK